MEGPWLRGATQRERGLAMDIYVHTDDELNQAEKVGVQSRV